MLLRRVIEHVKAQNWTAVVLDFVIVVVGILIAFQITEWNDARKDRMKEAAYLARLDAEMDVILERLETGVRVARESSEAADRLLAMRRNHHGDASAPFPEAAEVNEALRLLRAGRVPAGSPAAFKQMVSSGELTILSSDELRNALFRYDEFALIAREVWRGGWEEFLIGYTHVVPVIDATVDFERGLNETYAVSGFDPDRFFQDAGIEAGLKTILGAKVNHYEVLSIQLALAREIDALIRKERG